MTRRRPIAFLATLTALPVTVVALAGCGPHPLLVPEGLGHDERVYRRMRRQLAAASSEREADAR